MPKATRPKKKTSKRTPGTPLLGKQALLPIVAVLAAVLAAAVYMGSAPDRPQRPVIRPAPVETPKPATAPKTSNTYAPAEETPVKTPAESAALTQARPEPYTGNMPRIAIVIDDMGSDMAHLDALRKLSVPLGVAVLPHQPYSKRTAMEAKAAGLDVLLHLPMQADAKYTGLGQGALFTDMGSAEIEDILDRDLLEVPGAIGVNNHMGSAFTADKAAMTFVLGDIKSRGLFFLDSRTTAETVAESTAREMGVPTAARKVFLDDSNELDDVRFQFARLVKLAKKDGFAIAIGHPRPATLRVLGEEIPGLADSGIRVVRVSSLVN